MGEKRLMLEEELERCMQMWRPEDHHPGSLQYACALALHSLNVARRHIGERDVEINGLRSKLGMEPKKPEYDAGSVRLTDATSLCEFANKVSDMVVGYREGSEEELLSRVAYLVDLEREMNLRKGQSRLAEAVDKLKNVIEGLELDCE